MTVRETGDCGGDLSGEFATPSPVRESSPEWLRGSRFWLLQASDDEDEGGDGEFSPDTANADGSIRYLCRTPSPVCGIDLADDSHELARRTRRRIEKRNKQRMTNKVAMEFASMEGKSASSSLPLGKGSILNKLSARPVMEPSIFVDVDDEGGWTMVRRRHRPPVITEEVLDPKLGFFFEKFRNFGVGPRSIAS
jgi:hypothetical protein